MNDNSETSSIPLELALIIHHNTKVQERIENLFNTWLKSVIENDGVAYLQCGDKSIKLDENIRLISIMKGDKI